MVELLVVITIIAVLAGLLLPVFGRIAETGRTTRCMSNLKQVAAGILSFAGDHNGLGPLSGADISYHSTDPTTNLPGWTEQLEPYVGTDRTVYICPSSSKIFPNNVQYSYFQGAHAAWVANGNSFAALRLTQLAAPSKYILGGDITSAKMFTATDADKDDYAQNPAFATSPAPFHNGRVNLVFADGHSASFAAFDPQAMTTQYNLKPDGTGYEGIKAVGYGLRVGRGGWWVARLSLQPRQGRPERSPGCNPGDGWQESREPRQGWQEHVAFPLGAKVPRLFCPPLPGFDFSSTANPGLHPRLRSGRPCRGCKDTPRYPSFTTDNAHPATRHPPPQPTRHHPRFSTATTFAVKNRNNPGCHRNASNAHDAPRGCRPAARASRLTHNRPRYIRACSLR